MAAKKPSAKATKAKKTVAKKADSAKKAAPAKKAPAGSHESGCAGAPGRQADEERRQAGAGQAREGSCSCPRRAREGGG